MTFAPCMCNVNVLNRYATAKTMPQIFPETYSTFANNAILFKRLICHKREGGLNVLNGYVALKDDV